MPLVESIVYAYERQLICHHVLKRSDKKVELYSASQTPEACYYLAELTASDRRTCQRWLKTAMLKGEPRARRDLESIYNSDWSGSATSFTAWCNNILAFGEVEKRDVPKEKVKAEIAYISDVDVNVPVDSLCKNENTLALIIANENYQNVPNVSFALNDGSMFANYCRKTLNLPEKNIKFLPDATYGSIIGALSDIKNIAEAFGDSTTNIIFYYAGHGFPNDKTKDAYIMPVDADANKTNICLRTGQLIDELASIGARSVVMFLDACFSGAQRGDGMLSDNRAVGIRPKDTAPKGNMVMLSSALGDETAWPYKDKGHGMFTYFLLKKLQESGGKASLDEISKYVISNVRKESALNMKRQTPTVVPAGSIGESWRQWHLK